MVKTASHPTWQQTAKRLYLDFLRSARAPRLRTIREFAEQEIVIPDGPYKGFKFSCARQPHTRLWFDEIDSGRWRRNVMTGPVQSGKSLTGYIIPAMYYLFECQETVVLGAPTMEMAADKWRIDIEPVIAASRYKSLIPNTGAGSRGGKFESIRFRNGAELKFMSAGGGDEKRSGYTSRILIVTEVDKMDMAGANSREADPLRQMEARTASYGDRARVYLEGTVSIEEGRTWQEYQQGTQTRIALECPHCDRLVTPGREHLIGHQTAENEVEAANQTAWYCPECGERWSEADRHTAHQGAVLVHRGQEVTPDGQIVGPAPATFTLGYRYTAVNNFFRSAGDIGDQEWRAARANDAEVAEREILQFVFTLPQKPVIENLTSLDATVLSERISHPARGYVPDDTQWLTMGVDIGKYKIHWSLVSWRSGTRSKIVDYGMLDVPSKELGEERAILQTLRELRDMVTAGWAKPNGERVPVSHCLIDSGYQTDLVYAFCRESGSPFAPSKGQGGSEREPYRSPMRVTQTIATIADGYHCERLQKARGIKLVLINTDVWKSWLHERLTCPAGSAGAMDLFHVIEPRTHWDFAKQITAERLEQRFDPKKGPISQWVNEHKRPNHYFDAVIYACVAGHQAGFRLVTVDTETKSKQETSWFANTIDRTRK